jgi:type I restriction enzyme S subunit
MAAVEELVTDHLDLWTAAVKRRSAAGRGSSNKIELYGIKKLRELILELAVRGLLVPQDPNDEPASELLKKIAAEKAKLVKEGEIKKEKPLPVIRDEDKPYPLPAGWEWCHLTDLAFSQAGFAFKSNAFNEAGEGLPLIRIRDVGQPFSGTYYNGDYREEFLVRHGDYLISMDGNFRVAPWIGNDALLNQRVSRLIFHVTSIAKRFVAESLQLRLLELQGIKAYTTVDHLSGGQISESVIAFPPLAEQHRIVAKVDELMALCDQLERQTDASLSAHQTLVETLLNALTSAADQAQFASTWQRIAEHFDTLFTTEESIDQLKQTVLQLAVMGKLVPQDPNDEPASELLKKIAAEKAKLVKEGEIKADKPLPPIDDAEIPFELPKGWLWERLPNISFFQEGPGIMAKDFRDAGVPLIRISGMHGPVVSLDGCNFLDEDMVAQKWNHFRLEEDDIILSSSASLGKVSKVGNDAIGSIAYTGLIRFKPFKSIFDDYLIRFLGSREFVRQVDDSKRGAAILHFGPTHLRRMILPVPPLSEQHRIVSKVDELVTLCEQLKSRLSDAQTTQLDLADALTDKALARA